MVFSVIFLGFSLFIVYLIFYSFWKFIKRLHTPQNNSNFEDSKIDAALFVSLLNVKNTAHTSLEFITVDEDLEEGFVYLDFRKENLELILKFKGNGKIVYSGIFDLEGSCYGTVLDFKDSIPPVLEPLIKRFV